jgi:glycosyltransferase involved in cell wall biosynthesis
MPKKILFLIPYPLKESPSQRFRFEQYFRLLEQHGIEVTIQSFLTSKNWQIYYKDGSYPGKIVALLTGYAKRALSVIKAPHYDFIFVHREVAPVGPPVFEWILGKILRKKIIYDFDDAIWLTDRAKESMALRVGKWRTKVRSICKWSYKVSCGNEYLAAFAAQYNTKVVINPTTVDTQNWHNPDLHRKSPESRGRLTIGWTGSHSTLKYLKQFESILQKMETEFPSLCITIIADQKPDLRLRTLKFVPWNSETEIDDLLQFDIGVMPLPDDEWSKGKCGFKALQYMALRIPAVVSAVGVNSSIIENGKDGFLCSNAEQWDIALRKLIQEQRLREGMGENGRKKVIEYYSVMSNSSNFLSLFE